MSRPKTTETGADPECGNCGGEGVAVSRSDGAAVAAVCACVGVCRRCGGSGFARPDAGSGTLARCVCHDREARCRLFSAAGLPARHAQNTLASYRDGAKRQTHLKKVLSEYLRDLRSRLSEGRGVLLWGDVGRGKTHLTCAIARELTLRHGVACRWVEFSHLMSDLKAGFDEGRPASSLLDPLVQVDVLVIDELGKGRTAEPTAFELAVLDELVSRRYDAIRPIVAATNYTPDGIRGGGTPGRESLADPRWPALSERVGMRVLSRLRETCDFYEVVGEDHRMAASRARRPGS